MKRIPLLLLGMLIHFAIRAQDTAGTPDEGLNKIYRATATKINDLVHTKLDARFDYDKTYMYGKVWITLKPHFYSTDSLSLDAKGMDIRKVALVQGSGLSPLQYKYDGMILRIQLNKSYRGGENYTVFIDYTSKPNELKVAGSAAIVDAKGLYFINPHGQDKNKPTQIWTQGETEGTSVWCPTIDKPNQKSTEEISMTVPSKYVSLSNGKLTSQKKNADGTRTDTWIMDLPNAPYLFFMGIGPYSIVKDSYKGKEVSYYVEKEYEPVARRIFGNTPEMMGFYSRILGVEYPWVKYAQMTARNYVSGAMENTTATLHTDALQQDARQLVDGNAYEDYIAHELFHQWFGDLVTTESWSNLSLNESFADFSETIWSEYKYGKDAGDAVNFKGIGKYLADESNPSKDLIRFQYNDKEDVFDMVTYAKGGRILNMLKNYLGDSAFYKSLNLYLNTYKFKSAEAQELRLAFEEVTGQDLNWYWNQWYYGSGHPILNINYVYDETAKTVKVIIKQTQEGNKVFTLPFAIDVYSGTQKERHKVWMKDKTDSFTFSYNRKPDLVNVDGDKILLCQKKDDKTLENFIYQYKYAGLYLDRREAIDYCAKHENDPKAVELLKLALHDKYFELRNYTLSKLKMAMDNVKKEFEPLILDLAKNDPKPTVRGNALGLLASYNKPEYKELFTRYLNDSSYTIAGNALAGLVKSDPEGSYAIAKKMIQEPARGDLMNVLAAIMIKNHDEASFNTVNNYFGDLALGQSKFEMIKPMCDYISTINDTEKVKAGIDKIIEFRDALPEQYGIAPVINGLMKQIISKKEKAKPTASESEKASLQTQIDYIQSKIGSEKKGF
ncbi:MAG TPA: M1 family metallopeptidase [Puia sp.]|nr:M1 family metallopeptidase [Puia sp.]